jgi:hypothetical protein
MRVTKIGELGTLAAAKKYSPKRRFLQEQRGITSQQTAFFLPVMGLKLGL